MEYSGPQRHPPPPPALQPHGHPATLPPPHTYPPPSQPPPPPSPYDRSAHEQRNLPDPTGPHAYVQEHSGHNTPIHEQRFHSDLNYSRRSSASAARSPDGHHQYQPVRSMNVATATEGQHYAPQYSSMDPGGQPGYPPHEAASNGAVHHGLPTHTYEQGPAYPSSHGVEYAHSPVNAGPGSYSSINPYAVPFSGASRPVKKGNRATQVRRRKVSGASDLTDSLGLRCLPHEKGKM